MILASFSGLLRHRALSLSLPDRRKIYPGKNTIVVSLHGNTPAGSLNPLVPAQALLAFQRRLARIMLEAVSAISQLRFLKSVSLPPREFVAATTKAFVIEVSLHDDYCPHEDPCSPR